MSGIRNLPVFPALVLLALIFRACSFYPLVIDHDESTYIVIANELLHGALYGVDIFDTKPVGIFLLYTGFIRLAGHAIWAIRLLVAIWIAATAWLLTDLQRAWIPSGPGPWLTGVLYVGMISMFTFYGVSPNAEIYFSSLAVLAVWLVIRREGRWWAWPLAGLAIGAGWLIKQAVLFDALALGAFLLVRQVRSGHPWGRWMLRGAGLAFGVLIPLALVMVFYRMQGTLDAFLDQQFLMPGRYLQDHGSGIKWRLVPDFFLRFFPVTGLAVFSFIRPVPVLRQVRGFSLVWLCLTAVAALLTRNGFGHYFIPMMPPLALLAGMALHPDVRLPHWLAWLPNPRIGYMVLAGFILVNSVFQVKDYLLKPDRVRIVLHRILKETGPTATVYTGTSSYQILYFLLDQRPPVPCPHPSILFEDRFDKVFRIDREAAFERVRELSPDYCLFNLETPRGRYGPWLEAGYLPVDTLKRNVLYRRKGSVPSR